MSTPTPQYGNNPPGAAAASKSAEPQQKTRDPDYQPQQPVLLVAGLGGRFSHGVSDACQRLSNTHGSARGTKVQEEQVGDGKGKDATERVVLIVPANHRLPPGSGK